MTASKNTIQRIGGVLFMTLLFTLINALLSQAVNAAISDWETVSGATVEQGSRFYDKSSGYYTYNKITNNTGAGLNGPLRLVVVNSTHNVLNADGTDAEGRPYFNALPESGILATGETGNTIRINFAMKRGAFSYATVVQKPAKPAFSIDAPEKFTLKEGETKNISYTVNLKTSDFKTVIFTQVIAPQNGGLSLTNDAPPFWQTDSDIAWVVNGTITGNAPGEYKVTTNATIQGTSITATTETLVEVTPSDLISQVHVSPPIADPDGVAISTAAMVNFSIQVNSGIGTPDSVTLEQVDEQGVLIANYGALLDNGLNGDLVADDGIYSNNIDLPPFPEGNVFFRAVAHFSSDNVASEVGILPVTPFPTVTMPGDPATLITSDDPDQKIFSDRIIVTFNEGTPPNVIEATVLNVGGSIIGAIPSANIFQIGFPTTKTLEELKAIVAQYSAQPSVKVAILAVEVTLDAVYPNDTEKGSQINMQVSRVDEVWLLDAGGKSIAVVDTGVDYNHDDIKVVKGKDFFDNDNDPMDTNGHGTHVAGIAAAIINNGKSVAGVTNSSIIAVRALTSTKADPAVMADAIKYAAQKASVVNISAGFYCGFFCTLLPDDAKSVLDAVTSKLGDKIIVSTAGNDGKEKKRYPCANTNVFCVGSSSDTDSRSSYSNYGSWVDIAAPGENVLSAKLGGGTIKYSGTSMAAPLVTGAARLIWNQHSGWTASQVKQRLLDTANAASGLAGKKIGNRIDVFEAFFNGDFEIGEEEWSVTGTCSAKTDLGPIKPTNGKKMMFCSTGPAGDQVAATLNKTLNFVADSDFTIKFDYNFVSEEYPEFVGSVYDDKLTIKLVAPDGSETILAQESVNASSFTTVSGIDFPGGDETVGQTGWKPISKTIPVKKGAGSYKIVIEDAGDDIYDTAVLLDNIRLK